MIDPHPIGPHLIYEGDVLDVAEWMMLRRPKSVNCIVTSPPYYALRDYKLAPTEWPEVDYSPMPGLPMLHIPAETSCHGLESTPEAYIAHEVLVWRLLRGVLRDDGCVFVNIGDAYASGKGHCFNPGGGKDSFVTRAKDAGLCNLKRPNVSDVRGWGLQPGDMLCIPWRLGLALQADGWLLRMDNIWAKRSPMPESLSGWRWERHRVKVKQGNRPRQHGHHSEGRELAVPVDKMPVAKYIPCPGCPKCDPHDGLVLRKGAWRCTKAHEYILQLAKGPGYFADGEAVKEALARPEELDRKTPAVFGGADKYAGTPTRLASGNAYVNNPGGRNPRSVWHLSSRGYKGQHYATYPIELPLRCIKASISEKGYCAKCGEPWVRIVDRGGGATGHSWHDHVEDSVVGQRKSKDTLQAQRDNLMFSRTLGWRPSCDCKASFHGQVHAPPDPVRGIVLDPFAGTSTTGLACQLWGCRYIGIEKSHEYVRQSIERLASGEGIGLPAPAGLPLFEKGKTTC